MAVKKGFTLIELLVVVSIIALLLAIIMPSLNKAKSHSQFVVCKAGLHQYGLAGNIYLAENDNKFPNPYEWLYNTKEMANKGYYYYCLWHDIRNDYDVNPQNAGILWPYLASKKLHVCPTFRTIARLYGPSHPKHNASIAIEPQYSYCMNGYLGDGYYSVEPKLTGVKSPANTFFFCEENIWITPGLSNVSLNNNHLIGRTKPYGENDVSGCFASFHGMKGGDRDSGYSNAVFLDGRVEKVFKQDTFKLGWPK